MRKEKIFIIIFSILCFMFITDSVNAEEITVNNYSDFIANAENPSVDTIKIGADIDFRNYNVPKTVSGSKYGFYNWKYIIDFFIDGNDRTIDLNGHNLTFGEYGILVTAKSDNRKLNITDTSSNHSGKIIAASHGITYIFNIEACDENCYNLDVNVSNIEISVPFRNHPTFLNNDNFIAFQDEEKIQKLNVSNTIFTGGRFVKGNVDFITIENLIMKHVPANEGRILYGAYPRFMENDGSNLTLENIVPNGFKVVKDYSELSPSTSANELKTSFVSDVYVIKNVEIMSIEKFDDISYGYTTLPEKNIVFNNTTNNSLTITKVYLEDETNFSLIGEGNVNLSKNEINNNTYKIKVKEGLSAGNYKINVIAVDSNNNIYLTNTSLEVLNHKIDKPTISSEKKFEYDGNEKEVTLANYDPNTMDLSGQISGTESGTYVITITPKNGYCWNDRSTDSIQLSWEIFDRIDITNIDIINNDFVKIGNNYQMEAIITPSDASYKILNWSVENGTGTATITEDGLLKPLTKGTVRVKATSAFDNTTYSEKDITIVDETSVDRIMIKAPHYYLDKNDTYKLEAYVNPTNAKNKDIVWSSDDTSIATISQSGVLTPKSIGKVKIKAMTSDNSNVYGEIELMIINPETDILAPIGQRYSLTAYSTVSSKNMEWVWSDRSIIDSVTGGGYSLSKSPYEYYKSFTPIKSGYSRLDLINGTTNIATYNVYTYSAISNITTQYNEIILEKQDTMSLDISSWVDGVTDKLNGIYFYSEDSTIASIDSSGRITGHKNGNTNIIAFSKYNNQKVVIPISVVNDKNNYSILSEEITITGETKDLRVGRTFQYETSFKPSNTTNKEVTWSVENGTGEATIDQNGLLTAVKAGTVKVKATAKDGTNVFGTLDVTLKDYVDVQNIFIKTKDAYVNTGTSFYMSAIVFPANSTNKKLKWTSSNTSIATIDPDTGGLATNYKTGDVTITATATDGSGVTGSITLHVGYTNVKVGEITSLGNSSYVTYDEVIWDIADQTIVEPTGQTGKSCITVGNSKSCKHSITVKGLKNGNTTATMKTISGSTLATSTVYVYTPISNLTSDLNELKLTKNETKKINITITPDNISSGLDKLIYTSNDETIASVDQNGNVTALKNGNTKIVVYSQYNNISVTIPVTVATYTEELTLDTYSLNLNDDNRTHQISYEVLPEDAVNKNVTFKSNDTSIATVSNTGLITAVRNGTTTITVKTEDGRQTKDISITVTGLRKNIESLNYQSISNTVYNGTSQTPEIVIKDGDYTLIKNTDYTVSYDKNTNVGVADVNIEGIGNYKGTKTLNFNISKANINVTDNSKDVTITYDGKPHSIDVKLSYGNNAIVKYMDSKNEYTLNEVPKYTEVGTYTTKYKVYIDNNYTEYYGQKTLKIEDAITYSIDSYEVDETNKYINKIMVNTNIDTYKSNITLGTGYGVEVDSKEVNGKKVLYTGGETRILKGTNLYTKFTNVVIGDINGDGAINSADLLKIRQHLLRTNILSGAYFLSSDINYDNTINSADLLRVRQHLLGTKPIQ